VDSLSDVCPDLPILESESSTRGLLDWPADSYNRRVCTLSRLRHHCHHCPVTKARLSAPITLPS
jgi:hypothetical protein